MKKLNFEAIAERVGVHQTRIPFLKDFFEKHGKDLVKLRDQAVVEKLNGEELHALFIYVGQSIHFNVEQRKNYLNDN